MEGPEQTVMQQDPVVFLTGQERRIYSICLLLLKDPDRARQAALKTVRQIHRRWPEGSARPDPGRWSDVLAVRVCRDHMKS